MKILPLKLFSEIDQPLYGPNIFNLARLARLDLPVIPGIAITPPDILLRTILEYVNFSDKEVFEQRLTILKSEVAKISLEKELSQELDKCRCCLWKEKIFTKKLELWRELMNFWLDEIRSAMWRGGFKQGITDSLTAQVIFLFNKKISDNEMKKISVGVSYFDPNLGEVVIKSENKIEPKFLKQLDELTMEANKKLILPQVYRFIILEGKLNIVATYPFTQTLPLSKDKDIVIPKNEQKKIIKSAVKLFLNLSSGFATFEHADGILIEGERTGNFEDSVFKVAEAALSFPTQPLLYKLPDILDSDIRGSLRLINQKSALDESVNVFSFVRDKKDLLNVHIAVPFVRSVDEFLQIKKELSMRGVSRNPTLKLWLEMAVPENIINLDDYLVVGFDGVILNLDQLQKFLGGYDTAEGEFYKRQVQTVIQFIQPIFKPLHQAKIPIVVKGELVIHPDVLECLIDNGVWGIVANTVLDAESLPEHLNWAERRMIQKRFTL